jgi:gluconokinase
MTTDDSNLNYRSIDGNIEQIPARAIVIMGVSGCGKTITGKLLSKELKYEFFDADDFHSDENIQKMMAGQPLGTTDRLPWLYRLSEKIDDCLKAGTSIVLACSALKASYREILSEKSVGGASQNENRVIFVYLYGSYELIEKRMIQRQIKGEHWMNKSLLQSQFDALEPPHDALWVEIDRSLEEIVAQIKVGLGF